MLKIVCPQHARMCRVHDTCHGCVSDALLKCCNAKRFAGAVAKYCSDVLWH